MKSRNLEVQEILSLYPKLMQYNDVITLDDKQYTLDIADCNGNLAPFGFIFVRGPRQDVSIQENGFTVEYGGLPIIGVMNLFTKKIYKLEWLPKVFNVPDKYALCRLYHDLFPEPKMSFWDRLKFLFTGE